MLHGILTLNKPAGMTSRRAVDLVERLTRPSKVGHAGTLDPLAVGVLVACVGQGTRLIEYIQRMRKQYVGTFLLGRSSDTEDVTGHVQELPAPPQPTWEELSSAASQFIGTIEQRPPAFSALKVAGRRAYDLARRGEHVELAPRPVEIYGLRITRYDYPELTLEVECGSGTYIRSLGRDLAVRVGTAAVMSGLTRTAIGPFTLEQAVSPETLTPDQLVQSLQPLRRGVADLPTLALTEAEWEEIGHGRSIGRPANDRFSADDGADEWAALAPDGQLAALLVAADDRLRPTRVFPR